MLRKIIGFSVIMMVLSILTAQNDVKATINGMGWCEIDALYASATTTTVEEFHMDYISTSFYACWSDYYSMWYSASASNESYTAYACGVSAANIYCTAVAGSIVGSHYISHQGETWSGSSSNSF